MIILQIFQDHIDMKKQEDFKKENYRYKNKNIFAIDHSKTDQLRIYIFYGIMLRIKVSNLKKNKKQERKHKILDLWHQ